MTIQTIQPPADPGPRRWTASIATLIGEGYISDCLYGRDGEGYRATPIIQDGDRRIFTSIEVAK